jgi:hypothetical protein
LLPESRVILTTDVGSRLIKLADGESSISWGFALGEFKTTSVLRVDEHGEWTELGELIIGDRPPQKMMELRVRRSSR